MYAADPIVVLPYNEEWPLLFGNLATDLRAALGPVALRIDHIGSTAVPGLAAKPIIDVQISVAAFEPLDSYRLPLEQLRYTFRAQNPERTKRYFREPPGVRRTHIHVRVLGSWNEQFALLFRDYLRTHPAACDQYAALKRTLAGQHDAHSQDRQAYVDAKEPFIWATMRKANTWAQATGWAPGPSDA